MFATPDGAAVDQFVDVPVGVNADFCQPGNGAAVFQPVDGAVGVDTPTLPDDGAVIDQLADVASASDIDASGLTGDGAIVGQAGEYVVNVDTVEHLPGNGAVVDDGGVVAEFDAIVGAGDRGAGQYVDRDVGIKLRAIAVGVVLVERSAGAGGGDVVGRCRNALGMRRAARSNQDRCNQRAAPEQPRR